MSFSQECSDSASRRQITIAFRVSSLTDSHGIYAHAKMMKLRAASFDILCTCARKFIIKLALLIIHVLKIFAN